MDSIWYVIIVVVAATLILTINAVNTPEICQKVCSDKNFKSGVGINMRNNETCSTKFGMTYLKSEEYEKTKHPDGFKNVCCCEN